MLGKMKIWQKLIVIGMMMTIPICVLLYMFVSSRNIQIRSTREELTGLEYVTPLRSLLEHIPQHRGTANAVLNGDASLIPQLESIEPLIEADLKAIGAVDARMGQRLQTTAPFTAISRDWRELKKQVLTLPPKESFARHTQLIADVLQHFKLVGDRTALTTDQDLDTYYLSNSLLSEITLGTEYMGQLRGFGSGLAARGRVTPEERSNVQYLVRIVKNASDNIQRNMAAVFRYNPRLEGELSSDVDTAIKASDKFTKIADSELVKPLNITTEAKPYFDSGTQAISAYFVVYDASLASMRNLLQARISRLNGEKYTQVGLALFVLLLAAGFVYLVSRGITRQVLALNHLFSQIGIGDFEARAEILGADELGQATAALNAMLDHTLALVQSQEERDQIQESIRKLLEEISGLAEGDLTKEAQVTAEITGAIADAFNNMTEELRNIISKVQDATLAVSYSANEVHGTTASLASGSQSQALQIVEASAAIDEMAVSIQQVSGSAAAAAGVAETALNSAKRGAESVMKTMEGMNGIRQQVQQTAKRIKRLGESSQEIGEIVQLINDIAERTSILALNASIQAAMAGDAGRGFAVVAEEVERLAEHSTEATKKISGLIKSIQTETNDAMAAMEATTHEVVAESALANEAGQRLSEIERVSTQLAEIIQSISQASSKQSRGSEGVAKSMAEISQITQQTAEGAKQTAVSIRKLAEMADSLRGSLDRFKLPKKAA
jgi:twitching motility protein PilJ